MAARAVIAETHLLLQQARVNTPKPAGGLDAPTRVMVPLIAVPAYAPGWSGRSAGGSGKQCHRWIIPGKRRRARWTARSTGTPNDRAAWSPCLP